MDNSKSSPAAEVAIGEGQVTIGGVSIQGLEKRIRSLEALLGGKPGAQLPEAVANVNNKNDVGSASNPEVIMIDPELSDSEDGEPLRRTEDREGDGGSMNQGVDEVYVDERGRSMLKPTFTRMGRRYLSLETLERFQVPYEIDQDPEYVIIRRWVPEPEQDKLWDHTRDLRRKRHSNVGGSNRVRIPEDAHATSTLQAKIYRLPFEDWKKSQYEENYVLQVATEAVAGDAVNVVPVRLSIHSRHIWRGLRETTEATVLERANVMLPPWKLLVTYEEKIRKYLDEFEQLAQDKEKEKSKKDEEKEETVDADRRSGDSQDKQNPEAATDDSKPEEKKARFADEKLEIGDKPLPEGGPDITRVKLVDICKHCHGFHPDEFDCISEIISHWRCLIEFMDNDLKYIFDLRRDVASGTATEIAFADLWHLFNPGDLIFTSEPRRAYRVFNINGGRPCLTKSTQYEKRPRVKPLKIECVFLGFENQGFSPVHETIQITDFAGKLPIKALPFSFLLRPDNMPAVSVYPEQFEEHRDDVISYLNKRGKRAIDLFPWAHKYYCGISALEGDDLDGEIIIDVKSRDLAKAQPFAQVGIFGHVEFDIRELADGCSHLPPTNTQINAPSYMPECRCWNTINDFFVDTARSEEYKGDAALLQVRTPFQKNDLDDSQLMLLAPDIRAYVLKRSHWWSVYIDQIQDLDAFTVQHKFSDLVLPDGHEMMLKALIKPIQGPGFPSRADDGIAYADLTTRPREQALRILLHGPPGTGKISTAAAIAATTSRPLCHIRCMDISSDADEVQQQLRRAQQWNCVVLFHEADILFARRDARYVDTELNSCLSTLIDVLDLYKGIVLFSTRRLKVFDDAFVSRLHLALHFPKLNNEKERTMQLWRQSLGAKRDADGAEVLEPTEAEIMKFVELQWEKGARWDPRQIRNILETARAMSSDGEKLQSSLVLTVLNASTSFAEFHKASILEQEEEDKTKMGFGGAPRTTADSWEMLSRRNTRHVDDDLVDD